MLLKKLCSRHVLAPQNIINIAKPIISTRSMAYYPIDESIFGLTEEQQSLRQSVFNLVQKELAPYAQEIDKANHFTNLRGFWKQLGSIGALGITAKSEYGGSDGSYLDH